MPRSYRHIKEYEKEILEMREKGFTRREIAEKFGMTKGQIKGFISRYNRSQEKMEAGISLKKRGRPPKNYVVSEKDKVAELKYILARKDAKIKSLEMENELMRDFLSLTERK
jgi:transcriptional regulator